MSSIRVNMQERAGYQFCQILSELSTQINPIITDRKFIVSKSSLFLKNLSIDQLHNETLKIKSGFEQLINSISILNIKMEIEESERKHFRVDKNLDDEIQEGETAIKKLKQNLNQLSIDFEEKKREIITKQQIVSEQIEIKHDETSLKIMEDIAADGAYTSDIVRLQADRRDAQEKLDILCCSCLPCNSKKEKIAFKNIDDQITLLESKEAERKKKSSATGPYSEIRKLEAEQDQLKKQLDQLIESYPAHILEAKLIFDQEEKNLQAAKIKMQNSRDTYFSQISPDNVVYYVRAYACLVELLRLVMKAYSTKYALMQGTISKNDSLKILNDRLNQTKEEIGFKIYHLWYNATQTRTISEAYNQFQTLSEIEKIAFLQGKFSNELVRKITLPFPHLHEELDYVRKTGNRK